MATIASLLVKIGADTRGVESGLIKTQRLAASVGSNMTKYLTVPLAGVGVAAVKMAMDLEQQMANVNTLIGGNTQRVIELKKGVQDLSMLTGKSTEDLANGMYQVISAFGDTEHTMYLLETASKAAVAGVSSTEASINLLSAVIKGYNLDIKDATKVSDYAFATVRLGQTTYDELASSIGKVIPLAAAMELGQEELWGTMATATGVTGTTAEVVTQLRGVLQGLMKPSKEMQAMLEAIGYSSGTAAIKGLGLEGVLHKLFKQSKGNAEQFAGLWGQIEAGTLVLALTGAQADTWNSKIGEMGNVSGEADKAFSILSETSQHLWNQLKQSGIVILQDLGEAILEVAVPLARDLVPTVKMAVEWFRSLDMETKQNYIKKLGAVLVAGPLIGILAKIIGLLKGIVGLFATIGGAGAGSAAAAGAGISALIGPVAALAATFAGLYAGIKSVVDQTTGARMKWNEGSSIPESLRTELGSMTNDQLMQYDSTKKPFVAPPAYKLGSDIHYSDFIPLMDTGGEVTGPGVFGVGPGVKEIVRDKGKGGGINITITGNTISSDYDIDKIGDRLVKRLQLAGVMP